MMLPKPNHSDSFWHLLIESWNTKTPNRVDTILKLKDGCQNVYPMFLTLLGQLWIWLIYMYVFSQSHSIQYIWKHQFAQICMTIIVGDSILWNIKTKELTPHEIQTTGEGQLYFLLHQYILVILAEWSCVLNSYIRKEALRKYVRDTCNDFFVSPKRRVHPL